jgi:hypothetical protein
MATIISVTPKLFSTKMRFTAGLILVVLTTSIHGWEPGKVDTKQPVKTKGFLATLRSAFGKDTKDTAPTTVPAPAPTTTTPPKPTPFQFPKVMTLDACSDMAIQLSKTKGWTASKPYWMALLKDESLKDRFTEENWTKFMGCSWNLPQMLQTVYRMNVPEQEKSKVAVHMVKCFGAACSMRYTKPGVWKQEEYEVLLPQAQSNLYMCLCDLYRDYIPNGHNLQQGTNRCYVMTKSDPYVQWCVTERIPTLS